LAGETEVLGENPPQRHFVHHKSAYITLLGVSSTVLSRDVSVGQLRRHQIIELPVEGGQVADVSKFLF
jgi:hypothetical protein